MFTRVHGSKVISDEGFEVNIGQIGHDGLFVQYSRAGRFLVLGAYLQQPLPKDNRLLDQVPMIVEIPPKLEWLSPERQYLSEIEQREVLEKVKAALEFMGDPFKFESVP